MFVYQPSIFCVVGENQFGMLDKRRGNLSAKGSWIPRVDSHGLCKISRVRERFLDF